MLSFDHNGIIFHLIFGPVTGDSVWGNAQGEIATGPMAEGSHPDLTRATIHLPYRLLRVTCLEGEKLGESSKILPPDHPFGEAHCPLHIAEMICQTIEQVEEGPSADILAGECPDQMDPEGKRSAQQGQSSPC